MSESSPQRIPALEGLRGIASAVVVARHTMNSVEMPMHQRGALLEGPLAPLLNAQGAVQLFFVLSGYVLARSLARNERVSDSSQFLVRRVFRIHPPYVVAVAGALALWTLYSPHPALGGYTALLTLLTPPVAPTMPEILQALLFPGTASGLLTIGWTLQVEMIFSLLFPLLFLVAVRTHWGVLVAVSIPPLFSASAPEFASFSIDFSFGIALYLERARVARALGGLGAFAGAALFVGFACAFAAPLLLGWHVPMSGTLAPLRLDGTSIAVMAVGAAGLIALAVHLPWWRGLLSTRPVLFLGRVSFSLYLVHFPITIACARWLDVPTGIAGWGLLLAVVVGLSLPLSAALFRFVEQPSIRAGNTVCGWIARAAHTRALRSSER